MEPVKPRSPSRTQDHAFCPRYGVLRARGWRPQILSYPNLCAVLGSGVSAALAHYNRDRQKLPSEQDFHMNISTYANTGIDEIAAELAHAKHYGARVEDQVFEASLPGMLQKAVTALLMNDPFKHLQVIEVEPTSEAHGNSRPDVVYRDEQGCYVNDYKVKTYLPDSKSSDKPRQWDLTDEKLKWQRSWQMRHYCWQHQTTRYAVTLIILKPKVKIHMEPYILTSDQQDLWEMDAHALWTEIAHLGEGWGRGNTAHANEYGPCEFLGACLEDGLNERAMSLSYVQVPRRDK